MKSPRKSRNGLSTAGADLRKRGKAWLDRVENAGKKEKKWLDDAKKAVDAYTNETTAEIPASNSASRYGGYDFNILFSNVETIVPAVINSSPVPDIRRRFQDSDPAARVVSDILERVIRVQIDDSKLQEELEAQAQDAFLAGRGVIRLRYYSDVVGSGEPTDEEIEDAAEDADASVSLDGNQGYLEDDTAGDGAGDSEESELSGRGIGDNGGPPIDERLENERICFEAVSWIDYRHGPAKRWDERPWEAFRFCVEKEDEEKSFDAQLIGEQLSENEINTRNKTSKDGINGWEIWDKNSKKVIFVDDHGVILKEIDDPLGLTQFFCTATPVQPITVNGRLMPVNPFSIYRQLADDLEDAVRRKNILIRAMKVKGWYGTTEQDLQTVVDLKDDEFAPIANAEIWAQSAGGLQNAIVFWPIEKYIQAIQQIDLAIGTYKQWIYEITGISDIVRGASMASETATAQNIKSQWGSLRIQKMQRMMERGARDLFVMMSEIIPSKFSYRTLEKMTGIPILPLPNDPPEVIQQKNAVMALMKEKLSMYYRIDVESDSTIRADLTQQKQEIAQFLQGSAAYFTSVGPLVQEGALPADAALEIYISSARLFKLGRNVEDTLENMVAQAKKKAQQAAQQPQGEPSDPAQQAATAKMQADAQAAQVDSQAKQQDMQIKAQQAQFDMQRQQGEFQAKMAEAARKAEADGLKAQRDAIMTEMEVALKQIELQIKQTELSMKQNQPTETGEAHKPPSESISFKDLPPEGQAQMAAQAGIILSPQQMADHQNTLDAKAAAQASAKAAKAPVETL
jgi:hypothetical protein